MVADAGYVVHDPPFATLTDTHRRLPALAMELMAGGDLMVALRSAGKQRPRACQDPTEIECKVHGARTNCALATSGCLEGEVRVLIWQILCGILVSPSMMRFQFDLFNLLISQHVHNHGVLHGNLHFRNIGVANACDNVSKYLLKVGDFGFARYLGSEDCKVR